MTGLPSPDLSPNVIISILSVIGGAISTLIAGQVKRAIFRDSSLIHGYDQFTNRMAARIVQLEGELDRRDGEWRRRMDEADRRFDDMDKRLRTCESDRARLNLRIEELAERPQSPTPPTNQSY